LRNGKQEDINEKDPNVYAFLRRTSDQTVLVALNMSAKTQTLKLDWASRGVQASGLEVLYASPEIRLDQAKEMELAPFAAVVAQVK
jgi:glycosidase